MGFDDEPTLEGTEISNDLMEDIRQSKLVRANVEEGTLQGGVEPSLADFNIVLVLGKGTFGKVFLAQHKQSKKHYAIKVIRKDILIEYN